MKTSRCSHPTPRPSGLPPYELRAKSREMALLEVRKWGPDKIVDGQWNPVWTPVMLVKGEAETEDAT
jgi:hypothetical protein